MRALVASIIAYCSFTGAAGLFATEFVVVFSGFNFDYVSAILAFGAPCDIYETWPADFPVTAYLLETWDGWGFEGIADDFWPIY